MMKRVAELIPGFGEKTALDSTALPTKSTPNRKPAAEVSLFLLTLVTISPNHTLREDGMNDL